MAYSLPFIRTFFHLTLNQYPINSTNELNSLNIDWLIECYNQSPNKEEFFTLNFDKLAGTDKLRKEITAGLTSKDIKKSKCVTFKNSDTMKLLLNT